MRDLKKELQLQLLVHIIIEKMYYMVWIMPDLSYQIWTRFLEFEFPFINLMKWSNNNFLIYSIIWFLYITLKIYDAIKSEKNLTVYPQNYWKFVRPQKLPFKRMIILVLVNNSLR